MATDSYAAYKRYRRDDLYPGSDERSATCSTSSTRSEPVPLEAGREHHRNQKALRHARHVAWGAECSEAHETLTIAMNRIGAKSDSVARVARGSERYVPRPNGDNANSPIKQIASGRFGVTAEYLNACPRDRDQGRPGRQARRGRPAARLQGHRRDCTAAGTPPKASL